ncbi:hypothetical protein EHZ18_28095 [Burkholderia vietnamiensis]|nr:hypothetical protein EHZ18_28095 [Burkholderia vietnamiensis]
MSEIDEEGLQCGARREARAATPYGSQPATRETCAKPTRDALEQSSAPSATAAAIAASSAQSSARHAARSCTRAASRRWRRARASGERLRSAQRVRPACKHRLSLSEND